MNEMYSRESVLQAYAETGSLKEACARTGAPPYIAYIWLKKAKVLKTEEAIRYGTPGANLGAQAEQEFQRLVPKALNANGHLQKNCPSFDFDIHGITVDVKYSSILGCGAWKLETARWKKLRPDFFAAFFATTDKGLQGGYRVFLIPSDVVNNRSRIYIKPGNLNNPLFVYEINPLDLAKTFDLMAAESEEGKSDVKRKAVEKKLKQLLEQRES
jgi:hypothetical protein